jgi:L-iditol 2-dehydrogenase
VLCENRKAYGVNISCKDPPHLFGGWSEYIYLDPVHFWVYKLPKDLPVNIATLIEPMAVASRAFERAFAPGLPSLQEGYGPGKSIVVQGVGPIGLLVVAIAKMSGAGKIIAIDSIDERLRMAEKLGAETINLNEYKSVEERIKEVKRRTNGVGADIAFECAGVPSAFAEGIQLVRNGGKYVEVGHYTDPGGVEIRPHIICRKDIDILGSWAYPPEQFQTAINLLYNHYKSLPLSELVTHEVKIEEYEKLLELWRERRGIKIIVKP